MTPKENILRAIRRDNPEWVPNRYEATIWFEPPIIERPYEAGFDPFGVHWSYEAEAEGGTFPTHGSEIIADLSKWREQVKIPSVDDFDWGPITAKAAECDPDNDLLMGFVHMGLFERSYLLMGMEQALMAYLTEPELMSELLNALADYKISIINRLHDCIPAMEMIWLGDDWGTQENLFLPPSVWREIVGPPTKRVYDAIHARGMLVNQHSCGKIESVFGDMVEMGADMWNPCQPCNDLAGLKREYGDRIAFCGGIDSQFVLDRPGVTPGEVRAEVRKRIDEMAYGGGYIAAPSHDVPFEQDLIDAMNDEIATYGKYPLRAAVG